MFRSVPLIVFDYAVDRPPKKRYRSRLKMLHESAFIEAIEPRDVGNEIRWKLILEGFPWGVL